MELKNILQELQGVADDGHRGERGQHFGRTEVSSALMGEYVDLASRKVAGLRKLSLIKKILQGQVGASKEDDGQVQVLRSLGDQVARPAAEKMPPISDAMLRSLVHFRPAEVLATLSSMGIMLTTPEFIKFFMWKVDPSIDVPQDTLDRAVEAQGQIFELLSENPNILNTIEETGFLDRAGPSPLLAEKLKPLVEKRSQHRDDLFKRACCFSVAGLCTPQFYRRQQYHQKHAALIGSGALLAGAYALDPPITGRFEDLDVSNAMIKMAMDLAHSSPASIGQIAPMHAATEYELSFEEASARVGTAICP